MEATAPAELAPAADPDHVEACERRILPDDARLGRTVSFCLRGLTEFAFVRLRGALNADFAGRGWMELASVCLRGALSADFAG